ncbi:hypothetical protein KSS87_004791 [Heliosperma pusillum]|nr:hypothetical protein KSS87_004791 [Heliosperma pusillum]
MAPSSSSSSSATNWLSFSLSPNEPHTPLASQHYFLDPVYSNDWGNQKASHHHQELEIMYQQVDDTSSTVPKFEDFFGGGDSNQNTASYNNYFADSSATTTQLACTEFVCQSIEPELVHNFTTNNTATATATASASASATEGSLALAVLPEVGEKNDCSVKKLADIVGQRTSIYRGVTRHRWTGRYEAHLWDSSCRREGQARKGRQGGYDKEEKAARAYDLAALKYWGTAATINFPISDYTQELEDMKHLTKQEFIASLRRKSSGFSRGASIYRGVTRHHQQGRWQARIGRVAGNKDLYLATEEEAAEAYDIAAIKFRGVNAVTNFEMNRYDVDAILNSNLPIGSAAKRLKLATEASEKKQTLSLDQEPHSNHARSENNNSSTVNFTAIQSVPFDTTTAFFHQNLLNHIISSNESGYGLPSDVYGSSTVAMMPTEFYIWPNQSY